MSIVKPGIDTRYIIKSALNSKSMSTLSKEEDVAEEKRIAQLPRNAYLATLSRKQKERESSPEWKPIDNQLVKLCYDVDYPSEGKTISRFVSSFAQVKIRTRQIDVKNEQELLNGVVNIEKDCDLRETKVESLESLKKVGGTLLLDANSPIKNLSSLEEVGRKVVVYAKNREEMMAFLEKANFPFDKLEDKLVFVMKNYL